MNSSSSKISNNNNSISSGSGKYTANSLPKGWVDNFGGFKRGKQVICNVKYEDGLVLLAEERAVLGDMNDKVTEIGRGYGTEMNVGDLR